MRLLVSNTITALLQVATVKYDFSGPFSLDKARRSAVYSRHLPLLQCLCAEDWFVNVAALHPLQNAMNGAAPAQQDPVREEFFGDALRDRYHSLRVKLMRRVNESLFETETSVADSKNEGKLVVVILDTSQTLPEQAHPEDSPFIRLGAAEYVRICGEWSRVIGSAEVIDEMGGLLRHIMLSLGMF